MPMSRQPLPRRCRFTAVSVILLLAAVAIGQAGVQAAAREPEPATAPPAGQQTTAPAAGQQTTSPPSASTQAGLVTIESDRQQADNTTGVITATGNVKIVYPDRKVLATSRQAQYFSREARVVLSGDVQVVQDDGHRLLAEQVVYDVSQERVEARPIPGAQVLSIVRLPRPQAAGSEPAPLLPNPVQPSPR